MVITFIGVYSNSKSNIDNVLKTKSYSYLPKSSKEYIKDIYNKTGKVILTEKNKKDDEPYLNPAYVEYLKTKTASDYGYIPPETIVEHSYKNDKKRIVQSSSNLTTQSYYNLRDNGYIKNIYDQGDLGLCWAFAATTSLESHIAIKTNKVQMPVFSERQIDYATASLNETIDIYNSPVPSNYGYSLGSGGNMRRFLNAAASGKSPMLCNGNCSNGTNYNKNNSIVDNKYWKYDYNYNSPLSPFEVLNNDNIEYTVDEIKEFGNLYDDTEEEVNAFVSILKEELVNNGSLYVDIPFYDSYIVRYKVQEEKSLNTDGKNRIIYMPKNWGTGYSNHALSVIGWDDNYTHKVCLNDDNNEVTNSIKVAEDKYICNSLNAKIYTIKGAWILQNSWGNEDTFIYLPYTDGSSYFSSISKVEQIDFDNSYSSVGSNISLTFGKTKEVINKIKFYENNNNITYDIYYDEQNKKIYFKEPGSLLQASGNIISTLKITQPGLYTVDLLDKNIVLNNTTLKVNDTGYFYKSYFSIHTNNVEDEKEIDLKEITATDENILAKCSLNDNKCIEEPQYVSFKYNNVFVLSGKSKNLSSDDNLTFKILNKDGKDVTELFHIFRNFSVSNNIDALVSYNSKEVELGKYIIEVYYNNNKYDSIDWNLEKHNNIMEGIGTSQNPHIIKTLEDLDDIRNHGVELMGLGSNYRNIYGYYELANDIDLTYDTQDPNGLFYNKGKGWIPIDYFYGNFEGNNHVIKGLYINDSKYNAGLFGIISSEDRYIRNIIFEDVNIYGSRVGALAGYLYVDNETEVHDISILNGTIIGNYRAGGVAGQLSSSDENAKVYNLFNNADIIGTLDASVGGIIGEVYSVSDKITILDIANYGSVKSESGPVGGIVGKIAENEKVILKNSISAGTYKNEDKLIKGDVFGDLYENDYVSMENIYYLNNKHGYNDLFACNITFNCRKNTKVKFKDLMTNNAISTFEHSDAWINPEIDGVSRIPMLKQVVNHFDFTKIDDLELSISEKVNIYDLIEPNIDKAKNIEYAFDSEYLSISEDGTITPLKTGGTKLHILSYYDGYERDININIKETISVVYNINSDTDEIKKQEVLKEHPFVIEENTFINKGNIFDGWNTKSDGSGITYKPGDNINTGITKKLKLYAMWKPITYTIIFDSNVVNEETIIREILYPKDKDFTIGESNIFQKQDFVIDSWNTKPDGTGIKYLTKEEDYSINFDKIPFDNEYKIKLYAKWIPKDFNYEILKYEVNEEKELINKVLPGTRVEIYKENIKTTSNIKLDIDYKEYNEGNYVYTGSKTKFMKDSIIYKKYTNIVIGDINGDGEVNSGDLLLVRQHLLKINELNNIYFIAADINYDKEINSADLLRIRQHLLGTIPIK